MAAVAYPPVQVSPARVDRITERSGRCRGMSNDPRTRPGPPAPANSEPEPAYAAEVITVEELLASIALELNSPLTNIAINSSACLRLLAGDEPKLDEVRDAVIEIERYSNLARKAFLHIQALGAGQPKGSTSASTSA
jgi:signal transduction histidine kinase